MDTWKTYGASEMVPGMQETSRGAAQTSFCWRCVEDILHQASGKRQRGGVVEGCYAGRGSQQEAKPLCSAAPFRDAQTLVKFCSCQRNQEPVLGRTWVTFRHRLCFLSRSTEPSLCRSWPGLCLQFAVRVVCLPF